jgi:hypothetical protein
MGQSTNSIGTSGQSSLSSIDARSFTIIGKHTDNLDYSPPRHS